MSDFESRPHFPAPGNAPFRGLRQVAPPPPEHPESDLWDRRVANALAFLRRRLTGEYEVDEFGFDRELTDTVLHPLLRPLYRDWFRVSVRGVENIPDKGAALIVANHSGTVALDALMLALPEGFKGIGKLYRDRYKLQRFGRGGFVSAALHTRVPIIPVSIVGAEETYPMLGNFKPLARLLGTPYFPITPTFPWLGPLGLVPLPSKWCIEFGKPVPTEPVADMADDPLVIFNLADQVRETIQQTLHQLLDVRDAEAAS